MSVNLWINAGAGTPINKNPTGGFGSGVAWVSPPPGNYWVIATGIVNAVLDSDADQEFWMSVYLSLTTVGKNVTIAESQVNIAPGLATNEQDFAFQGTVTLDDEQGVALRGRCAETPNLVQFDSWTVSAVQIDQLNGKMLAGMQIAQIKHPTHLPLIGDQAPSPIH